MALTNKELVAAWTGLNRFVRWPIESGLDIHIRDARDAIGREMARLANGPFTLAEAVASGRPFRRKGWVSGLYADGIYDSECGHCECEGPIRFSFVTMDIENAFVEADDITAIDYELQEGEQ